MSDVFINSHPIDLPEVRQTGTFSTIPPRINKRNDLANAAASRLLADWGSNIGDGMQERYVLFSSPVGNLGSFVFVEALPELLGLLRYLLNLGTLVYGKYYL